MRHPVTERGHRLRSPQPFEPGRQLRVNRSCAERCWCRAGTIRPGTWMAYQPQGRRMFTLPQLGQIRRPKSPSQPGWC
ncbi:hypothetical protein J2Z21_009023 [Streptomyces griseochromogenes]|uniref:Uncharacterized protein n=1 Tax=Streptomyces griseochromogenes TaxID=68214 RepID=A0ABS4M8K3_9ACTN|nr:hypothetical protein [Streptomyces griseochromogenes]